ncbi:hypothetical protein HH308_03930 [Gordonia sp. TBRC 11910]|uniref:Secreted protein n=1 Tax=Gordonia asplenii TaxID=2725283 RepID=A0A848KW04_9ACTN|nr:hypothetical protein [Gordonia asplenii]NMO00361.1 hypothetical protein [Gordonia asplenii]
MMKRTVATLLASTAVSAGLLSVTPATADAAPHAGAKCARTQANDFHRGKGSADLVCAHVGSGGYRWVRVTKVDPVRRSTGERCTGQYSTAVTKKNKALVCLSGRWRTSP